MAPSLAFLLESDLMKIQLKIHPVTIMQVIDMKMDRKLLVWFINFHSIRQVTSLNGSCDIRLFRQRRYTVFNI